MIWTKQPIKKEIAKLSSDKVDKTDIVNTLTDTSTNKPLSAAQGKALNDKYTTLNSKITTPPVTYTSYADVKSGITSKAASMASGSIASFDFYANYSTAEELPGAYYTCILRKYDNNSYVADIISNVGADYKLTYSGNTWRMTSLSSKFTLIGTNNVNFIRYSDGRVQQKFYNGNIQEIFTFDPNKTLSMSHSNDGSTFQNLWSISTDASRETKSIVEQSNFSISSGIIAQVVKRGNIAEFNTVLQCNSPFDAFPGTPIFTDLPIPYANGNTYVFFDIINFGTAEVVPIRLALTQDGTLHARYGVAGKAYDVHIVYLTV